MQRSLLIGCGHSRIKKVHFESSPDWVGELTTLDMNPDCGATHVIDMSVQMAGPLYSMPFGDDEFDELAAYDALEHWGRQGDWRGWFGEMAEYHRILKPGGTFGIIVPIGEDALVDPGHTRFFHANWFHFLSQAYYERALAEGKPVTDYRWYWKLNFEILFMEQQTNHHIGVMLRKA